MMDFVVVDTETTGFSPKTDRLIEFGAAHFDPQTGELGDTLHLLINPGMPVPAASTAIHGITTEQLADKPAFAAVAGQIADFVRGKTVIIHQASFDTSFLNAEFKKAKHDEFDELAAKIICTRRMSRYGQPSVAANLDNLCDTFGIDRSIRTTHGAMIDCFLLAQIYPHLAKLKEARDTVLSGLLPFTPGAELPLDLDFLGKSYVMMNELVNRIKAEQERVRVVMAKMLGEKDVENDDFCVSFGPPKKTTDWKKIKEAYLLAVDLTPYEKTGEEKTMKIEAA
jgi:DNA polymerase-3 subunit epsilon